MHAKPMEEPVPLARRGGGQGWLAEVCREALSAPSLGGALDRTAHGLVEIAGYFSCSIGLLDAEGDAVVNRAWHSSGSDSVPENYQQGLDAGVVARAMRSAETVLVPDVRIDDDYVALFPEVRSEICLPLRADGKVIGVLDVNSDQIDDFDEKTCRVLETLAGMLVQIIEKNRLLEEVAETRDYLESLIAAAGDAIVTADRDAHVQRWNQAAERMLGYSSQEMRGQSIYVLWHPDDAAPGKHLFDQSLSGQVVEGQPCRLLHKDGRVIDVIVTFSPICDAAGRVVGAGHIIRDVSEQRRLEAQSREMHRRVAASEEKYRSLVEHAQEAIFLVDPLVFTIQEANPCAVRLTGRSADRLTGMRWTDLVRPKDMDAARAHLEDAAATGSAGAREIRLHGPEGREVTLEITAGSVRSGRAPFLQIIGRDVTERRIAEGEREAMRSRLLQSEKLSVMGELISGVAHELNNPLTGVIGYAQLLLDQERGPGMDRNIERIQHEAQRCHRIVQNLLAFARKKRVEMQPVSINDLLNETLELRAYPMRVDNIWVVREFDADLPLVEGDRHQLQQVFVNLVTNAHQSMASTGRSGVLTVVTRQTKDRVSVRISDNGPGIDEEICNRIFEPFFTTKEAGKGTGLGLSLCHGIVQDHGGTISVSSRPGKETSFVVDLPIAATEPRGVTRAFEDAEEVAGAEGASSVQEAGRRLLVVDDEETILEFLSEALRVRGHQVDTAANGLHALDRVREKDYDAVITDLKMPGMSGRQFYEALCRELPGMARRVIFATGDLVAKDTIAFLESTGNAYLEKPFSVRSIAEALQRLEGPEGA